MDPKKAVVWFLLSVQMVARAVPRFPRHSPQVSAAYTLATGMRAVQSVSMGQIASLLEIPSSQLKIPANSLVAGRTNTPLREALDTACRVRSRVELLAGVMQEMPNDLELNVLLVVMRQIQRDTYHWLAVSGEIDQSVLSEKTLDRVCQQWEALVVSEEAEQSLREFITAANLTTSDSHREQITSATTYEIIMSYFSH